MNRNAKRKTTLADKKRKSGFSIIELMVAMVLMAILVGIIYTLYASYEKAVLVEETRVEIAQNARATLSKVKTDMEMIGAGTTFSQPGLIYAAPWEMLFNADIGNLGELSSSSSVTYGPDNEYSYTGGSYLSDAETVHLYVPKPDASASNPLNVLQDFSIHPYDSMVMRGSNVETASPIGFGVRYDDGSMPYQDNTHVRPLFTFWGDFDLNETTAPTLWGDGDGNGQLSDAEIVNLFSDSYSYSYQGPRSTITVSGISHGAVFMNMKLGQPSNDEDSNGDNTLSASEDLNRNGKLDRNLLDTVITRIDLNVSVIASKEDAATGGLPHGEKYREETIATSVDPRNLGRAKTYDSGDPPQPPRNVVAALQDCGYGILLTWDRSLDDGLGDNDVAWYEIERRVQAETGSTWGNYAFYAYKPAERAASYSFVDTNIVKYPVYDADGDFDHWTFVGHQYRVTAVDFGNLRSTGTESNQVTPTTSYPQNPTELDLWDTACYIDTTASSVWGSITLHWKKSSEETTGDQYWIYRSEPNQDLPADATPIAKIPLDSVYNCNHTQTLEGERYCYNQSFYKDQATANYYTWRDQDGSPGRYGSTPPQNGKAFGLPEGGYGTGFNADNLKRYQYVIKYYRNADECLSKGTRYISACDSSDNEAQSYSAYFGSDSPGRFSPPWNVDVMDGSTYYSDSSVDPALYVTWTASPSQFCEPTGSPNTNIPDLTWYYVYRSIDPMAYDTYAPSPYTNRLKRIILKEDAAPPYEPTGQVNLDSTPRMIVFKGNYDSTLPASQQWLSKMIFAKYTYSFIDSRTEIDEGRAWKNYTGSTAELNPDTGSPATISDTLQQYHVAHPEIAGSFNPDYVYEYMVAAVTAYPTTSGGIGNPDLSAPWSFGASCVAQGKFDCECLVDVQSSDMNYCGLVDATHTSDGVEISWRWDDLTSDGDPLGIPLDGSTVTLMAKDIGTDGSAWFPVETVIDPALGESPGDCGNGALADCGGTHPYVASNPSFWCPGTNYNYALRIECPGSCTRFVNLGLNLIVGSPAQAHICFLGQRPSYDTLACPDTLADCTTGNVAIELRDVMPDCVGNITTDENYLWWRVERWSLYPSEYTGDPTDFDGDLDNGLSECFPAHPETCTGTCGSGTCPGVYKQNGYWLRIGEAAASGTFSTTGYEYATYTTSYVKLKDLGDVAGTTAAPAMRRYLFSEVVNPNRVYKYRFSIMVSHPPDLARPVCSGYASCSDQCNGAYTGLQEFQVIVDFGSQNQCYPPVVAPYAGSYHSVNVPPLASPGGKDNFSWSVSGDISRDSPENQPWRSNEYLVDAEIDFGFFTIPIEITDHEFEYSSGMMATQFDSFFGTFIGTVIYYLGSWGPEFCGFGIWGIDVIDYWTSCYQDMANLRNNSFVFSNFNAGVCQSTGPSSPDYNDMLEGDLMVQMHARSDQFNRRIDIALRSGYVPWELGHIGYMAELSFRRSRAVEYNFSFFYFDTSNVFRSDNYASIVESYPATEEDDRDSQWWSIFFLMCKNRNPIQTSQYNENYFYMWAQTDVPKTWDWKPVMYSYAPVVSFSTKNKTISRTIIAPGNRTTDCVSGTGWTCTNTSVSGHAAHSCTTGAPLRCVTPEYGKFGFWADPFLDTYNTEYYYDNLRIDPYCGQCPPLSMGHWTAIAERPMDRPPRSVVFGEW